MGRIVRVLCALLTAVPAAAGAADSTCFGTAANGRLEGGVRLPDSGPNYTSYSTTAGLLGRTHVHGKVARTMLDAYAALETAAPGKVYKYAETGFREGGEFRPHKTHRNGLSVDFMVPVLNEAGESVHLPTHCFNRLGYAIEFDDRGRHDGYRIDFEAMAAHLVSLHKAAAANGIGIDRVIFAPELQPLLMQTGAGRHLKTSLHFSTRPAWVRHDEHYHVDFAVPCKPL